MNFTAAAAVIATLMIAALTLSLSTPPTVIGYTPRAKLEALDYIAVVNALAHAESGGGFTGFLEGEVNADITVLSLNLSRCEKSAVVVLNHGWANVTVKAYLRLIVLEKRTEFSGGQNLTVYRVRVESDRPVELHFNVSATSLGNGEFLVSYPFRVSDNRGLWVEP